MSLQVLLAVPVLGAFALAVLFFALAHRRRRRALIYVGLALACVLSSLALLRTTLRQPAPVPDALSIYYLTSTESGMAVQALRARDGQPRWQRELGASAPSGAFLVVH